MNLDAAYEKYRNVQIRGYIIRKRTETHNERSKKRAFPASESHTHLALECSRSRVVFQMLGIDVVRVRQIDDLFIHGKSMVAQNKVAAWEVVIVAILWNIWLARNRKVFDGQIISVPRVVRQCSETLNLCSMKTDWNTHFP
ncbi:hypothetical protein BRADI_4g29315v3 [Brachypodium distachyon]|uniref:Uncharacterized protein n=1 Tax=Brachypodium distachyon TaxID=15368 RepID=A0A2K2CR38_BRADI|nr:hypothetical protein BRADI_4g29315v3 [Brachypodium distachyon]